MSVYYIASLKINYFTAQNVGNKVKARYHDPSGYIRSQKYPGYQVVSISVVCFYTDIPILDQADNNSHNKANTKIF